MKLKITLLHFFAIAMAALPLPLRAAVTFSGGITGTVSELSSTTELAYNGNQSSTDLINGLTATAVSGWTLTNGSTVAELNDGIHGLSYGPAGNTVAGTWTTVGATATYTLGAGANGLGYDITSLRSIAAWANAGLGNQAWTLETQAFGGGAFATVVSANFQPFPNSGTAHASQILLTDLNITGIQAVRITANSVASSGNGFVFREFDVIGASAIPEPGAAILGGLGLLMLLHRRRH